MSEATTMDANGENFEETKTLLDESIAAIKPKGGFKKIAATGFGILGTAIFEIGKTGIAFMAFYYLWAYSGLGLLPFAAIVIGIGLLLVYIARGLNTGDWNPLNIFSGMFS